MLPFLKIRPQNTGIMTTVRKPDESSEPKADESGLDAVAKDLTDAVHAQDIPRVKAALKAAFEIMDSEPESEPESEIE